MKIEQAVAQVRERYAAANPASRARHERARSVLPGGNTRSVLHYEPFPLGITGGSGCRIRDLDGHEYLDLLGEYTAALAGHSDPVIRAAIVEAAGGGLSLSGTTDVEATFAAAVTARFPSLELLRFTNSGTEANLMALATAVVATGRRTVLVFDGAYHGGVLSFPAGAGPSPVNVPHEFVVATYNDVETTRETIRALGDRLAAVIVEPALGSGGCVPGEPAFLHMLREETARGGALLILDEVMTSRLAPGGRQAALGVTPDLTTLGKYLGGGLSFGAFGGRAGLMARYDPQRAGALGHAGTFNNNVLTMSAGLAALTRVFTVDALEALNARGDRLRAAVNERFAGVAAVATGTGSILNIHFTDRPVRSGADAAASDPRLREVFFHDLLHAGIHLAPRGLIALSLPVGEAECTAFLDAVSAFVAERRDLLSP